MNKVVINQGYGGFELSEKAVAYLKERLPQEIVVDAWGWDGMSRHHPLLVEVVEKLGKEASGSNPSYDFGSELVVVTILEDRYCIKEVDDNDTIYVPSDMASDMEWTVIG